MNNAAPGIKKEQSLDDIMLAMDVVDTLRHNERMIASDLSADDREAALIARLRRIYKSQGIDVPDEILRDGVKALEEKRFVYEPPEASLSVRLATLYVTRDRWLRPLIIVLAIVIAGWAAYHFMVEAPKQAALEQRQVELTELIPQAMDKANGEIIQITEDADIRERAASLLADGKAAASAGEYEKAVGIRDQLNGLAADLRQSYQIRIISRPGEYSGIFRVPENNPGGRNYYLIVEAVDAAGEVVTVPITSEEDQQSKRVKAWGIRVSEQVFNTVAEDKADDQIIQNAVIGAKARGKLAPDYAIPVLGGQIVEW